MNRLARRRLEGKISLGTITGDHLLNGELGLKLMADENAHLLLLEENLPGVFEPLSQELWNRLASTDLALRVRANAQHLSTALDFAAELDTESMRRIRERCNTLRHWDLTLLARLLEHVLAALEAPSRNAESNPHHRLSLELEREVVLYFAALNP